MVECLGVWRGEAIARRRQRYRGLAPRNVSDAIGVWWKRPTRVRHPCWAAVYSDALPVAYFLVTLDIADLAFGGVAGHDGLILWP
jgi:hypothetical protein